MSDITMYVYSRALEDDLPYLVVKYIDRKFFTDCLIFKFGTLSQCLSKYESLSSEYKFIEEAFIVDHDDIYYLINHCKVNVDFHIREAVKRETFYLYGE